MFTTSRTPLRSLLLPLTVAIVIVLAICSALYLREADVITSTNLDNETRRTDRYIGLFAHDVAEAISDLRVLTSGDGFNDYLATGRPSDLDRAVRRAEYFSKDNPDYDQIRYIDENGQEILRIDKGGAIVPRDQLQNKGDRSYFQKTNALNADEIFISALNLNVEGGVVEQPIKPTFRVAMPVFDPSGHRRGIYIINFLAANSIERLRSFVDRYRQRFRMLNSSGYWLAGETPAQEWGFEIPGKSDMTLAKTDPELWVQVSKESTGQVPYHGGYFSWTHAAPSSFYPDKPVKLVAEDDSLIFASQVSAAEWASSLARLRQTFVVVAFLLTIFATAIAWVYQARRRANQERDRFFNLTRDMLCVANFEGYFTRVNPAWEKALGYTADEIKQRPFLDFVHPEDRQKTVEQTVNLSIGGEVVSFENRYRCKDGSYRWLLWSARPLVEQRLIYASARDLTERKQIEEKLKFSEERLRLMVESVKDYAIYMLDPAGRVISWNAGAQRLQGYTVEEIMGQHFSRFYSEEQKSAHQPENELMEAAAKGRFEEEGSRYRKDGSPFWASVIINAVRNTQGDLIGFSMVTRDISERKKAVEALLLSEERSRSIIESAHDGFISIDVEGRITEWNIKSEAMFGWTRGDAMGRYLHETILPPQYRDAHVAGLRHLRATGEGPVLNKTIELSGLRRNGQEFPLELVIWPLQVGNVATYHAFVRDITGRKQAEERIQKLNEELKQRADLLEVANKELESFSYSVSHDLRAPLRHIHGFVELLQKSPALAGDTSAQRYMGVIAKAAREMGLLIDDLLAFSRTGRAEMHPVKIDMSQMVGQIIRDFAMETQERIVTWNVKPMAAAAGDPALIRLVWVNLLGNAVKYTGPRQEAKIEVGELTGDQNKSDRRELIYYVRDNGVGFDMQYSSKLFGVFQRLHRAEDFEGTGIGLANVQRIILRHGGRVWAEAKVDEGATFFFSLPVTTPPV